MWITTDVSVRGPAFSSFRRPSPTKGQALAVVLPGADELTEEQLLEAPSLCPVDAIRLLDADGNDVAPEI